jgi:hypothetical protein
MDGREMTLCMGIIGPGALEMAGALPPLALIRDDGVWTVAFA